MTAPTAGRVLLAEDSLVIRAVVRSHLEDEGYEVVEAADGHEALARCRSHAPDIVLLDIEMPGLDGHQVLAALKADEALAALPVVFLTGRTAPNDIVRGIRAGAHDYLKKPFEATELIARVGAAVRTKRLQDELRARNAELDQASRTDALTGVANRRQLDEVLRRFVSVGRRHDIPVGVVILDLDHFKSVNDTWGHDGGDAVLKEFARRAQIALREEDLFGRWGGEEFLVLLPATDAAGALRAGERIRQFVAASPFPVGDGSLAVTVSGGATSGLDVPEELVRQADAALYEAKAAGRDRVVVASGSTPVAPVTRVA